MNRLAPFPIAFTLLTAGLLAGCDSQAALVANPANLGKVPAATANLVTSPSLMLVFPQAGLPQEMKDAKSMKMLFGSMAIPMTTTPAGLTAPIPQTGGFEPDLAGRQRFVFILDRTKTQVVDVQIN